jgi:hypothetical protein
VAQAVRYALPGRRRGGAAGPTSAVNVVASTATARWTRHSARVVCRIEIISSGDHQSGFGPKIERVVLWARAYARLMLKPTPISIAPVSVRKSLVSQQDLKEHSEHASCSPDLLRALGCVAGQQVLVRRSVDDLAMYTLSEVRDEHPTNVVRMGLRGRGRLGGGDTFDAIVDPVVVDSNATEDDARTAGLLIERLDGAARAKRFIAIAPHGGDIELHTDSQAERVAASLADVGANCWRCKGWAPGRGASSRWHITSTDIHPAGFPLLATVTTRGQDLNNLVNRLTRNHTNGIQLEQSVRSRDQKWSEIADPVASVYRVWFRTPKAGDQQSTLR